MAQAASVLFVFFLMVGAAVNAQQPAAQFPHPPQIATDTGTAEEGRAAGRLEANNRRMEGRATAGFVGGLLIGTLGVTLFREEPLGQIALIPGLAIIGGAWRLGDTRPPETLALDERRDSYRRAYMESYAKTLRSRRGKAALIGGVAGAVTGAGALLIVAAIVSSAYD